jgi:hypothetical protein
MRQHHSPCFRPASPASISDQHLQPASPTSRANKEILHQVEIGRQGLSHSIAPILKIPEENPDPRFNSTDSLISPSVIHVPVRGLSCIPLHLYYHLSKCLKLRDCTILRLVISFVSTGLRWKPTYPWNPLRSPPLATVIYL